MLINDTYQLFFRNEVSYSNMRWEILGKDKDIVKTLLKNRGIADSKIFFEPQEPKTIYLKDLGVSKLELTKAFKRIKQAKSKKEKVIIYGDYDADGICATAILWEAINEYGLDVLPHIPDRFKEGYGINATSVENLKLKIENLKLIITVDNGIVGYEGIKKAKELGIDVIVLDHHQPHSAKASRGRKDFNLGAYAVIHSTEVCGSALAYFFSKELGLKSGLELATIGTIADQMPLIGVNRSVVKYGLQDLKRTKRVGLKTLFSDSKIDEVGTYEVNYIIAPRINAMGRLANGLDSLRLLCTKKLDKAQELSKLLTKTNTDRQKIVDGVATHALDISKKEINKILVLAHESYHEGVIGLAAGKLVEKFYKPSIVISIGKEKSKASARSVSGFNIIEAIKKTELILEGGGHPMAAGFSIDTTKIEEFTEKINTVSDELLTEEMLTKKLKIDMELTFDQLNYKLVNELKQFEPIGVGNPGPTFVTRKVEVVDVKTVGKEKTHLKLKLKQGSVVLDAIGFGLAKDYSLKTNSYIDIAYNLEENVWNGNTSLQLKIRDIKL
ncbi:MAG TPA: single-stranded-DNA-specific exonuclease RecJ [Patescibacteria group bacterium]|nr:single-stranded-DNA-specific exonuclease RecJ [Patescibacteria group bacterium]